ncbi:MAG: hypothetical protein JWQ16_919 [Novosphingobium sp.]|nr:hypothetical protein [Novosphingobium sp.]
MGDLINLRQARKAKNRVDGESQAEANRAKHGRTKAEKRLSAMARQKLDAVVNGARRERVED